MSDATIWWLLTGLLVLLELTTGTFYLLMLAVGMAAGALAAHAGLALAGQLVAAATVGLVLVCACYLLRRRRPGDPPARAQRSVNLDVGEVLRVEHWDQDRTATVRYRGAQWTVQLRDGQPAEPGLYRIAELVGNRLLVDKA
jgi:membrane protein implicated in regulation of membrane protease activity